MSEGRSERTSEHRKEGANEAVMEPGADSQKEGAGGGKSEWKGATKPPFREGLAVAQPSLSSTPSLYDTTPYNNSY